MTCNNRVGIIKLPSRLVSGVRDVRSDTPDLIERMRNCEPLFWNNPLAGDASRALAHAELTFSDVLDAEKRWQRFAPLIRRLFGQPPDGIIESPLVPASGFKSYLEERFEVGIPGQLFLKCDNRLSIAGSIKARGGLYEVFKHAESLLIANGLLTANDNYSKIADPEYRRFLSEYSVAVASTGNLGLSVGTAAAALGFKTTVHMSVDAKKWKKELLRRRGAFVIEYSSDYSGAIEQGRIQASSDPKTHFVDDENSPDLFLGYSVAALRTSLQISSIVDDRWRRVFFYLPCGVGGAPGGITFGMKNIYLDRAVCLFAEPTHAPALILGLISGRFDDISARDLGIDGITIADGLAVTRPSGLVCRTMERLLDGAYTIEDSELLPLLSALKDHCNEKIEPSAAAALIGPIHSAREGICNNDDLHVAWLTGGSMIPEAIFMELYNKGKASY